MTYQTTPLISSGTIGDKMRIGTSKEFIAFVQSFCTMYQWKLFKVQEEDVTVVIVSKGYADKGFLLSFSEWYPDEMVVVDLRYNGKRVAMSWDEFEDFLKKLMTMKGTEIIF